MTDIPILYRLLKHMTIQPLNGTFWLAKRIETAESNRHTAAEMMNKVCI